MIKTVTIYDDTAMPIFSVKIDFDDASVTMQNGKGHNLIKITGDSDIVEYAGYHARISNGESDEEV